MNGAFFRSSADFCRGNFDPSARISPIPSVDHSPDKATIASVLPHFNSKPSDFLREDAFS